MVPCPNRGTFQFSSDKALVDDVVPISSLIARSQAQHPGASVDSSGIVTQVAWSGANFCRTPGLRPPSPPVSPKTTASDTHSTDPGSPPPSPPLSPSLARAHDLLEDPGCPPGLERVPRKVVSSISDNTVPALPAKVSPHCGVQGLHVVCIGSGLYSVAWHMESLRSKLRTSRGFPLPSPAFALPGLRSVRLLFAPGSEQLDIPGAASSRNQVRRRRWTNPKAADAASMTFGTVSVKVGEVNTSVEQICFRVFVGTSPAGKLEECNLSERAIQRSVLDIDWRKFLEAGTLSLRMEFFIRGPRKNA